MQEVILRACRLRGLQAGALWDVRMLVLGFQSLHASFAVLIVGVKVDGRPKSMWAW